MTITYDIAKQYFQYKDGNLYWKLSNSRRAPIGAKAGSMTNGYLTIRFNKTLIKNHRIVFLLHHGYMPDHIDHINGCATDNRIENLRECTQSQNNINIRRPRHNRSGYKNVCWAKSMNKWQVKLRVNGKTKSIGHYKDLELADLVATMAREKFHGEFARHD